MDQWPYSYPHRASQVYEGAPCRAAQLLIYPSVSNPQSAHVETPHKHVKLSIQFKRLLVMAIALPLLALILVIYSSLSTQWERVEFVFERLMRRACLRQTKVSWRLAHVVLEGAVIPVTRFDNQTQREICHQWKQAPTSIVGVGMYTGSARNATVVEVFNVLGGAFQVCSEIQGMSI